MNNIDMTEKMGIMKNHVAYFDKLSNRNTGVLWLVNKN